MTEQPTNRAADLSALERRVRSVCLLGAGPIGDLVIDLGFVVTESLIVRRH